jgi:hypothetical protein
LRQGGGRPELQRPHRVCAAVEVHGWRLLQRADPSDPAQARPPGHVRDPQAAAGAVLGVEPQVIAVEVDPGMGAAGLHFRVLALTTRHPEAVTPRLRHTG